MTGGDYADFADYAHFDWVTSTWRAVVAPHQTVFIGVLAMFEAAVGLLILLGGRGAELGYAGAVGFHLALWLFGWFVTIYALIIVPALVLLLLAVRRAARNADAAVTTPLTSGSTSSDGFRGEAAVNLTDTLFGGSTACTLFANTIPSTGTGKSDTADNKDTILTIVPPISTCTSSTVTTPKDSPGADIPAACVDRLGCRRREGFCGG